MKKRATRKGEQKLIDEGYEFHGYEYDHDAQKEVRRLEKQGIRVWFPKLQVASGTNPYSTNINVL